MKARLRGSSAPWRLSALKRPVLSPRTLFCVSCPARARRRSGWCCGPQDIVSLCNLLELAAC
eukprot:11191390-Lingulodinium_polyedra.AAC.1